MRKIQLAERPDWQSLAADVGFTFAEMYGEPYWEEKSAYQFTLRQIEDHIPVCFLDVPVYKAAEEFRRIAVKTPVQRQDSC